MNRTDHPTAETIYAEVRTVYPHISLGTVYRNLNLLSEKGEILRLKFDDGTDHFDANTSEHHHLICRQCKGIVDIYGASIEASVPKEAFGGRIDGHLTYFYGLCDKCIEDDEAV